MNSYDFEATIGAANNPDPKYWTDSFYLKNPGVGIPEGVMLAWFTYAMAAARDDILSQIFDIDTMTLPEYAAFVLRRDGEGA